MRHLILITLLLAACTGRALPGDEDMGLGQGERCGDSSECGPGLECLETNCRPDVECAFLLFQCEPAVDGGEVR
jgi:hypothetical protein